ncbi:UBX domain-containing protein 10 [Narcine bancroftii]|uniref:UBX domain-containing protein 10 n=1 Tax=Narcine bancroftii TaxID=1343680 RepID=UPI0038312CD6
MAAAEPTSRPPSVSKSISFDLPVHSITDPDTHIMNTPRPKSAKGRSRSTSAYAQDAGTCSYSIPVPTTFGDRSSCPSSSAPECYSPTRNTRVIKEEVPELLHHIPSRPSSSLNRYRVLPSIGRREASGFRVKNTGHKNDQLNFHVELQEKLKLDKETKPSPFKSISAISKAHFQNTQATSPPHEPAESEPRLRLAVRYPSGQRFESCFRPSDTLQTILSVAEWKSKGNYKNFVVETMDVPRRSFSDLSKTLEECGIQNKSVLCILQCDGD